VDKPYLSFEILAPFLFTNHDIHHDARGESHLSYVKGWSPDVYAHDSLTRREAILMVAALGPEEHMRTAADSLRAAFPGLFVATFASRARRTEVKAAHVLLVRRGEHSKGTAIVSLARRLGLGAAELAAVGDWWNDVPLFAAVGKAFAMGQAPAAVAASAHVRLTCTDETGGAVAEAVGLLLGPET
jgi:hydroxymethylpyrimidine pyrophosphatase-like HAD family hydrolase